jgi:hypothetical protein
MKTSTYDENEWRLVPVVITDAMEVAADKRDVDEPLSDWGNSVLPSRQAIWTAMLEAAPQPPTIEESLKVGDDSQVLTALIAELRSREQVGRKKYGQDLDRTDLSEDQLRQHLREELMDALMYSHAMDRAHPQRDAADAEELNRLRIMHAEGITEDMLCALLPGCYYMDPPDGGDTGIYEQLKRMAADAARYRWLRSHCAFANDSMNEIWFDKHLERGELDTLDRQIDAAMGAGREEAG